LWSRLCSTSVSVACAGQHHRDQRTQWQVVVAQHLIAAGGCLRAAANQAGGARKALAPRLNAAGRGGMAILSG
jgi:hypothetical protein